MIAEQEAKRQHELDQFVRAHVHLCLSGLVATLAQGYGHAHHGGPSNRELLDLCEQAFMLAVPVDDYEEAAIQAGYDFEKSAGSWCYFKPREPMRDDPANAYIFKSREEAARAVCEAHELDPYPREVYEHWAITDRLAELLEAEGERVDRDFAGLTVWARTTTGQAISMDGVIERCKQRAERELHEAFNVG
jgi:hypothetical protein